WAIKDREVKYVPDVNKNQHYIKHRIKLKTKSECTIPLKQKNTVIGALDIQSDAIDAFSDEDIHILNIVADQLSVALQNAKLYGEATRRAERLSAVNNMAEAVNTTLKIDELLEKAYRLIKDLFKFDVFYLALYEEKSETLDYRIFINKKVRKKPAKKHLSEAHTSASQVIKSQKPLNIENLPEYLKDFPDLKQDETDELPVTLIALPLKIGEQITGVISIQSYSKNVYSKEDEEFLYTLADQIAIALENARLFKNLRNELIQRKNVESQLIQAQKMEAVGRLAGGIAHDFNNLLTAIIGYTDLLFTEVTDEHIISELNEIKKASRRAATLTSQLLAFSRKQFLSLETLNINQVVMDMESMLRRLIREDIDLEIVLSRDPCLVKSDRGQLNQVIMNLAVNARDVMPKGGKLTIETANVELGEEYVKEHLNIRPGYYVMLAVSDTGSGMDRETIKHIFEPFFTTKEPGEGTGLGLSMAYGIIKQSNGEIYVYSEPGKGTIFKIYLPGVEPEKQTNKTNKSQDFTPLKGSEAILLVEDDAIVRRVTAKILTNAGYTVFPAGTGREAIELSTGIQNGIDLIITDVVIRGKITSTEMIKNLLKKYPELKVMYISGYTENTIVHRGILKPGIFFLQKPFSPEPLLKKVRETIENY
ncbi:MAG: GAF domain-containing protein, partial [Spirochaetes bacterium]|nr:GAF domain-containing protein [Spirochaetota bacterium]